MLMDSCAYSDVHGFARMCIACGGTNENLVIFPTEFRSNFSNFSWMIAGRQSILRRKNATYGRDYVIRAREPIVFPIPREKQKLNIFFFSADRTGCAGTTLEVRPRRCDVARPEWEIEWRRLGHHRDARGPRAL